MGERGEGEGGGRGLMRSRGCLVGVVLVLEMEGVMGL